MIKEGVQKVECNVTYEYPCIDGLQCVPQFSLCDKEEQCRDGSDEISCPNGKYIYYNSIAVSVILFNLWFVILLELLSPESYCNSTTNGGCQHYCHSTLYYRFCSCFEGYYLNTTDLSSCHGKYIDCS